MYDTLGRVGQKTLANGTSEHYAYDTRSRLTQVQLKQGATVLRTTGYAWDNADQITSQTVNGVTTNYGYDLAGQLTSEVRSGYNVAYTYDANGNRLSKTVNGVAESYTYDNADKMLTAGAKSYTYDAAGRTVGINAPGGTTTLSYDYESRVTAISGPGINETHTYNGLDTRVGTVQGGVSRAFVRDGSYVTDPVLRDGQATYTPGVSERRGGVSTWSHSGLKNADAQTTSVGAIAATRVYDAFGAELSATGTWKGPFGYAGGFGYQEDSSGLKLLGHRYYDPTTGRFLSRDPIKDGRNWYIYCENDPADSSDPQGFGKWDKIWSTLYILTKDGGYRKVGITKNPGSRYGKSAGKLRVVREGNRGDMRDIERYLEERFPGPDNKTPWAGNQDPAHPNYGRFKPHPRPEGIDDIEKMLEDLIDANRNAEVVRESTPKPVLADQGLMEWIPGLGELIFVNRLFADWLNSWVPEARAGMNHTRIQRWMAEE